MAHQWEPQQMLEVDADFVVFLHEVQGSLCKRRQTNPSLHLLSIQRGEI